MAKKSPEREANAKDIEKMRAALYANTVDLAKAEKDVAARDAEWLALAEQNPQDRAVTMDEGFARLREAQAKVEALRKAQAHLRAKLDTLNKEQIRLAGRARSTEWLKRNMKRIDVARQFEMCITDEAVPLLRKLMEETKALLLSIPGGAKHGMLLEADGTPNEATKDNTLWGALETCLYRASALPDKHQGLVYPPNVFPTPKAHQPNRGRTVSTSLPHEFPTLVEALTEAHAFTEKELLGASSSTAPAATNGSTPPRAKEIAMSEEKTETPIAETTPKPAAKPTTYQTYEEDPVTGELKLVWKEQTYASQAELEALSPEYKPASPKKANTP
jgi:hypothetical protein